MCVCVRVYLYLCVCARAIVHLCQWSGTMFSIYNEMEVCEECGLGGKQSRISWRPEVRLENQYNGRGNQGSLQLCGAPAAEAVEQSKHGYNMNTDLIFSALQLLLPNHGFISSCVCVCILKCGWACHCIKPFHMSFNSLMLTVFLTHLTGGNWNVQDYQQ